MLNRLAAGLKQRANNFRLRRGLSKLYRQTNPSDIVDGKFLFWVPGGMSLMLHVESAIAAALRLRGVEVNAVICDGPFRACILREVTDGISVNRWQERCSQCKTDNSAVLDMMGVTYSCIGDFVPENIRSALWGKTESIQWEGLDNVCFDGVRVGQNVRSAIIRYLKGYGLAGHEAVVREYAYTGLVVAAAAAEAFKRFSPSRIYMSHGVYADWGPALHMALSANIPVTAWMASYLKSRFYFRHVEDPVRIDFHNMSHAAWDDCKGTVLSSVQKTRLDSFMVDRYKKRESFDMKRFMKPNDNIDSLRRTYRPSPDKPVWGIISHINWDTVSDYSPMAYETFDDWLLDTIREIIPLADVHWLVKVHPAELWDNPESGVQKLLSRHFPSLPPHVQIISAEEEISPFDFFRIVDGGVTVYGTAGLEIALQGKPVILAGEAHYGGKGFTHDRLDIESYRQLLRKAGTLGPLSEEQRTLAERYAYCYFIQRQIPLPVVKDPGSKWWGFQFNKREHLLPGKDPFVEFICERIMDGKDFIMDEKLVALSEGNW